MKRSLMAVTGLCGFLVACDDVPVVQSRITTTNDLQIFIVNAQKAGPVLVKLDGIASTEGRDSTNSAVLRAIQGVPAKWNLTYTRDPNQISQSDLFLAMQINGTPGTSARELCAGANGGEAKEGGEIRVFAAFCKGGRSLSSVVGTIGKSESVEDVQVSQLLQQVMLELLP